MSADWGNGTEVKLSLDGQFLQTICHANSVHDHFSQPCDVAVSPEDLIYICHHDSHSVTVHGEDGKFLFVFGSRGSGPGCLGRPCDVTFPSNGLMHVTDIENKSLCVV